MPDNHQSRARKSIDLFRSLSPEEFQSFCRFVNSPFFNTDEKLTRLAVFLSKALRNKQNNSLSDQHESEAFTTMFGKPKSKKQLSGPERAKLNDKLSRLTKLGLQFLNVVALEEDSPEKTNLLLHQLHKRKLTRFFDNYRLKEQQKLETSLKNKEHFLNNYQLERSFFEFQFTHDINKLLKSDNLAGVMEALDVYYLVDRMLLHLAGMALINAGAKSYDFRPMEAILELSELEQYRIIPSITICRTACYMEASKLQSKEDASKDPEAQQYYEELVALLNQHDQEFTSDLSLHFYTLALNFCSHQIKLKNHEFLRKGFELYRQLEEKGLFAVNGRLRAGTLVQAITMACRIEHFEWAEATRQKYIQFIDAHFREGTSSFIQGQIAFYRGDFEQADRYLMESEQLPFHRSYSLGGRILRLKCLYELQQYSFEAAKVRFKSEINFRKNNKFIAKKDRDSQNNFIRVLTDIYKIRELKRLESMERISERLSKATVKLNSFDFLTDASWLERKMEELY